MYGNPYIQIAGRSWIAMIANGIAADEQIVNLLQIQQFQKLFEVAR